MHLNMMIWEVYVQIFEILCIMYPIRIMHQEFWMHRLVFLCLCILLLLFTYINSFMSNWHYFLLLEELPMLSLSDVCPYLCPWFLYERDTTLLKY